MDQEELNEMLEDTLTVGQLIQKLQKHDAETPVVFAYPSGDYHGRDICSDVLHTEVESIKWSPYYRSLVPENQEDSYDSDYDEENYKDATTNAVIIRG